MTPPKEPPNNCLQLPGLILEAADRKTWITKEKTLTRNWEKRGIWETQSELTAFFNSLPDELYYQSNDVQSASS